MSNELTSKLNAKIEYAENALKHAASEAEIEAIRVEMIGRNGFIPAIAMEMKNIPNQEKPGFGKAFNIAKNKFETLLEEAREKLKSSSAKKAGQAFDVSLPGRKWAIGKKHPVSKVIDDCVAIFRRMGFIVAEGPEVETVHHNFDALNTPADHPSRDPQDTFYFGDGRLLRTQTSTVQIRYMEKNQPPVRIISPGRCFRRDTPDATHSMNFHQIEGLYIDKNVSMADLKSTLLYFGKELMGSDTELRLRPHFFPFTEPSVECDFSCIMCGGKGCRVCKFSGWLEIAGAGMVNPAVMSNVGYDPEKWNGYAFGMGIERIAMIRYRIGDIRLLYENDVRFLEQF